MSAPIEVRVEKSFLHPRERIFDAFVDPARVGDWLFHRPDGVMETAESHPVPDGKFAIFERRGDDMIESDRMLLSSRGPSFDVEELIVDYEDVWQIQSPDERALTGRISGQDGTWRDFLWTRYRRKGATT